MIELFLMENYRFRRNILNGKVEFATLPKADHSADGLSGASNEAELVYRPLTQAALNSIVIRARREQVLEKGNPKSEITEYVQSEEVPEHNPVQAFLDTLPMWDGQNHIAKVFGPLVTDGYAARQRVCAHADRTARLRKDQLRAPSAALVTA